MKSRKSFKLINRDYTLYNLLSAIRGPDYTGDHEGICRDGQILKAIITNRIRAIIFRTDECAGDYESIPLTPEEVTQIAQITKKNSSRIAHAHFRQHLYDAVVATITHPIWNKLGSQLLEALRV